MFLRQLQLQSCRVHALGDSEHNHAEDWPHLAEFRTRQQQHQALRSGSPKSSFRSTLNLENLECLQKKHELTSSSCQSPVWVLFLKFAWAEGREIILVHAGERRQQALQMELSCLAGAGGGGSLGSGVAGLAAHTPRSWNTDSFGGQRSWDRGLVHLAAARQAAGRRQRQLLALPQRTGNSARCWAAARPPLGLSAASF